MSIETASITSVAQPTSPLYICLHYSCNWLFLLLIYLPLITSLWRGPCFWFDMFVWLWEGSRKNYRPDFHQTRWKHEPRKKPFSCGVMGRVHKLFFTSTNIVRWGKWHTFENPSDGSKVQCQQNRRLWNDATTPHRDPRSWGPVILWSSLCMWLLKPDTGSSRYGAFRDSGFMGEAVQL